jgi:uncharacterized protein (DUF302 family)
MEIAITTTVGGEFDATIEKTIAALKEEGFGVLTRIDVKATMKEKIGADFMNYVILGACNPKLAHQALTTTLDVGLVMPCNVVVSEREPGTITVAAMNPKLMDSIFPDVDLSGMANAAEEKIRRALGTL